MNLRITTPLSVIVDQDSVSVLRAEDPSGSFGILPGHADFLTSLAISVVRWQVGQEPPRYCAVRQGVLTVSEGQHIAIATREAVLGKDIATLADTVLAAFEAEAEAARTAHVDSMRLQLAAIRRIVNRLGNGAQNLGSYQ